MTADVRHCDSRSGAPLAGDEGAATWRDYVKWIGSRGAVWRSAASTAAGHWWVVPQMTRGAAATDAVEVPGSSCRYICSNITLNVQIILTKKMFSYHDLELS